MASPNTANSSLVRRAAQSIRVKSLASDPGERLGGEDELMAQTGVSRPTFRQASKLVEQEQLLRIKRGVGGGYFADRPDSAVVSHITAIYLHTRQASLNDILSANRPLYASTVRLATQNLTPALRRKLLELATEERATIGSNISTRAFVRSTKHFTAWLAEACGNPLIQLFQEIVLDLSALVGESVWIGHPERIEESRKQRLRLIDAMLDGDAELAAIIAGQTSELTAQWASESTSAFKMVLDGPGRPRAGEGSHDA